MKFRVESYGCTMNQGEGHQLAERLAALGHEIVVDEVEAEAVLVNTCVVIEATESRMLRRIRDLRDGGKEIVATGCVASVHPERVMEAAPGMEVLPPSSYGSFEARMEERYGRGEASTFPIGSSLVLPISQGCLGQCTYCITRLARGSLNSYPIDMLMERASHAVGSGATELLVTSQDTACYGADIGSSLPELLHRIKAVPGRFRIRVGMMNPDRTIPLLHDLLDAMDDPKVYRFLHVPVQSGSDDVLFRMGRRYDSAGFESMVADARRRFPDITIATDVIVGFPGETDDDHRATISMLRRMDPDIVNVTRFSRRPGTAAVDMPDQVVSRIAKERSREMTRLRFQISERRNAAHVGLVEKGLVTEHGKDGTTIVRTGAYRPVVVPGSLEPGTFLCVRVTGHARTHLFGKVDSLIG